VCAYRKQWQAKISYDGERHHLGNFDTQQEAALEYDKEARKCGGENKLLNYNTIEEAEEAAAQARVEYGPARQRARPASGYYGVYAKGKRWQSMVCFGSKKHHLGSFDTKQEAALAYDKDARKSGKEGKMLNYDTIEEAEEAAAQAQTQTTYARRQGRVRKSRRRVDAGEKGGAVVGTRTMPRMKDGMPSYRNADRRAWMKARSLKEEMYVEREASLHCKEIGSLPMLTMGMITCALCASLAVP
jgi:hypothetical protein